MIINKILFNTPLNNELNDDYKTIPRGEKIYILPITTSQQMMRRYRTRMNFLFSKENRSYYIGTKYPLWFYDEMRESPHTRKAQDMCTLHHSLHYTIGCFLFWFFDRLFIKKGIYLTRKPISFFWAFLMCFDICWLYK